VIPERYPRLGLIVVLVGFLALSSTYNLVSPPFENPDEISHAEYAAFIADHLRLPDLLTDCVRLAFHPPLYHALIAPIAAAMGVSTEDVLVNHRVNPDYQLSKVILVHDDPGETFPYEGRSRFVHLARAVTMLIAVFVLIYTYRLTYRLTNDSLAGLIAAATVAAVPQFEYIAASINHDAMAAALAAAFIYYSVLMVQAPSLRTGALTGMALGAGLLVKSSIVVLSPLPLALWIVGEKRLRSPVGRPVVMTFTIALAICGWWYANTAIAWGTPFPIVEIHQHTWVGSNLVRTGPFYLAEVAPMLKQLFQSFWFLAGLMNIPATSLQYACWIGVSVLALVGIIGMLTSRTEAVLALAALATVITVIDYNRYVYSSQGRYLFIILPIVGLAVARGFTSLTPSRARVAGGILLVMCLATAAIACVAQAFAPIYADIRSGERSTKLSTPQLYCHNEYSQIVTSRGGMLRGIQLHARRIGDGTFDVQVRIDTASPEAQSRTAVVPSTSLSADETPLDLQFAPLRIERGERYRITVRAPQATPSGRAALTYNRTGDLDHLLFDGKSVRGELDVQETLDTPEDSEVGERRP
jgi:hypothetical protein